MTNYIQSKQTNILNGLLSENIELLRHLNFISGENGTLKTKFLQSLKESPIILNVIGAPCNVQAISPKRNAQRKAFASIFDLLRKKNMKKVALYAERQLLDTTFEEYPSLGDQFYVVYDDLCGDGGNQEEKMQEVTTQFNSFIQKLFPHYELTSSWDRTTGKPNIELLKNGISTVPLEGLSLGEQEMLALVSNIYNSRDIFDVFLIDEPELHLNWHLEERLFSFFSDFCEEHDRQMVVVTHSRAVFLQEFLPKTQFFVWEDDGTVKCEKKLSKEQRTRIAGDAIEIMKLGTSLKATFFVEDNMHEETITAIAEALEADISVSKCGNSQNVRSFFVHSKRDGGWDNTFFVQDGDNMGNPHNGDETFIHLDKYCMENYFIDPEIAATVTNKNEGEIREIIFLAIQQNKEQIFKKNKFFEFLTGLLEVEHITDERLNTLDASLIFEDFLKAIGMEKGLYIAAYIGKCIELGVLETKLPEKIIAVIKENIVPEQEVVP